MVKMIRFAIICLTLSLLFCGNAMAVSISPDWANTVDPIAWPSEPTNHWDYTIDGHINILEGVALGNEIPGPFTGPYIVSYYFNTSYDLTGFELWNNLGISDNDGEGVNAFELVFYNSSNAFVGSYAGFANDSHAKQSFSFGTTIMDVVNVDFVINSSHDPGYRNYAAFQEVAFVGTNPVPEPTTMLLFGTGLAGLAGYRRKKR